MGFTQINHNACKEKLWKKKWKSTNKRASKIILNETEMWSFNITLETKTHYLSTKQRGNRLWLHIRIRANYIIMIISRANSRFYSSNHEGFLNTPEIYWTKLIVPSIGLTPIPLVAAQAVLGLAFRRSHDQGSLSAVSLVICSSARIAVCNTWSSGGTALCRVGSATSQLDLPSLTQIIRSWLWLTATRSSPLGYYCK